MYIVNFNNSYNLKLIYYILIKYFLYITIQMQYKNIKYR